MHSLSARVSSAWDGFWNPGGVAFSRITTRGFRSLQNSEAHPPPTLLPIAFARWPPDSSSTSCSAWSTGPRSGKPQRLGSKPTCTGLSMALATLVMQIASRRKTDFSRVVSLWENWQQNNTAASVPGVLLVALVFANCPPNSEAGSTFGTL